jgi:two-component system OmpR family sensor kinase
MTLSIRTRLTLWYAAIVIVVLTAAGAAMVGTQTQLGLRRLDDELDRLSGAMLTVLANEIDERHDLALAAGDATEEIDIKGRTVVILSADGKLLASNNNKEGPDAAFVASVPAASRFVTVATSAGDLRIITVSGSHEGQTYTIRVAAQLSALARERSALLETLAVGLWLALLLAGVGGWIIGRQALRPLVAMAQETSAMTTLTPDERVTVPAARDELAQLGQAFNGLLDRLDAAMSAQRQFMADASHELRTPVSVTRTAAQVTLGREHRTEQEYRESLTIVTEQAERLTRMVDDMFLLARADAHARPLDATAIYLGELLNECTRAVRVLADERGVDVRALGEPDVPFVGDENLLRQLLINLLENGVAHTPPGGTVTAELRTADDSVEIAVTDSGPGVDRADRDRIFERFVRLAPSAAQTGAGLGLPIARWIAERHGGRLTLESSAPAGARFVVWLPYAPAAAKRDVAVPAAAIHQPSFD